MFTVGPKEQLQVVHFQWDCPSNHNKFSRPPNSLAEIRTSLPRSGSANIKRRKKYVHSISFCRNITHIEIKRTIFFQFFTHIFQIVRLFSQRKPLIKKNRVVGAAYFLHFPFRLLPVLKTCYEIFQYYRYLIINQNEGSINWNL